MTTVDDLPDERCENAVTLLKVIAAFRGRYEIAEEEPEIMQETARDLERCGLVTVDETYSPEQGRVVVTITLKTRRKV